MSADLILKTNAIFAAASERGRANDATVRTNAGLLRANGKLTSDVVRQAGEIERLEVRVAELTANVEITEAYAERMAQENSILRARLGIGPDQEVGDE